jgi:hypothetical protein
VGGEDFILVIRKLFFGQIRKMVSFKAKEASVAGISTASVCEVAIVGVNFEFGFGLQCWQLDIAFL